MIIYLMYKAKITLLKFKKVFIIILEKYLNFANIFF